MKKENLKKIINEVEEENSRLKMSEIFDSEGEKELSEFLKVADEIENKIEPDKSILLNILSNLPQDNKLQPELTANKIKLQIGFNKWMKFAIPAFVAILAVVIFLGNPFTKEQSQITDISKIYKEERTADKASNLIQNYIAGEKQSVQVAQSLSKTVNSSASTSSSSDALPFDSSSVALEASSLSFDPNLAKFVSQENSMSAIDATLASF